MSMTSLSQTTYHDIKHLFKTQAIQKMLINQIEQIFQSCLSIIIIYQKLFIKIKYKSKNSPLHIDQNDHSLFMIKINKSFPLENSVRLYLLNGCYQPKIYDTRDLVFQALGEDWSYKLKLLNILQKIPELQQKISMQKTGQFLLGDVFVYNQLQQHTSLSLFVDKSKQNNSVLNAVSQTHFFTFKKVNKKVYKTKQQQQYEMKSKTLYGKKFILSKCCQLQCIQSMQVNIQLKQINLTVLKYRTIKSFNQFQSLKKQIIFNQQQSLNQFLRIILKNLPKYQPTKMDFRPCYQKSSQQSSFQKVIQLNQLQNRLQNSGGSSNNGGSAKQLDKNKKQELVGRLNKSYQKLIQFYSARAHPYYLIYVNKLNWLYMKYFIKNGEESKQQESESDHKRKNGKVKKSSTTEY